MDVQKLNAFIQFLIENEDVANYEIKFYPFDLIPNAKSFNGIFYKILDQYKLVQVYCN